MPEPGRLRETDEALINLGQEALESVGASIAACRFREGLRAAMSYAQETNRYLNQEEPWKADREEAARALYVAINAIDALKLALYPYLPFTSARLHKMLGHASEIGTSGWATKRATPGRALQKPEPLFKKLDPLPVETH